MALVQLTRQLRDAQDLSPAEVDDAVADLVAGDVAGPEKAEFLKALRDKGESAAEIAAFVRALLARAVDPEIDPAHVTGPMLDVCGTGGDKLDLFNISTAAM